ncbi:MAG: hypothetical protein HGB26_07065 [Desulfobulbaceae bacterium]|nr:hypothetical protein [Desulfobulbaceae bacterium]
MKSSANQLDLSPLPPTARRELRDFFQFLLARSNRKVSGGATEKRRFMDLCGGLSWQGDALATQRSLRDEW